MIDYEDYTKKCGHYIISWHLIGCWTTMLLYCGPHDQYFDKKHLSNAVSLDNLTQINSSTTLLWLLHVWHTTAVASVLNIIINIRHFFLAIYAPPPPIPHPPLGNLSHHTWQGYTSNKHSNAKSYQCTQLVKQTKTPTKHLMFHIARSVAEPFMHKQKLHLVLLANTSHDTCKHSDDDVGCLVMCKAVCVQIHAQGRVNM